MSQSNLNYPNNNFTNTQNYSSNNSSSVGRPSNSMFIQKSTIISSSKVDTSKIINPIAKKDWNTGTDALKQIFNAKDEEIEYWKNMCDQQEITISQLEIVCEQKSQYESDNYQIRMYLSQKENEIEQLKRTLDESNRFKDLKIEELEEKVANLAVENERLRNMLLMKGQEIDKYRNNISQLDIQISDLRIYEFNCREKDNQILQLIQNIDEWKNKYNKIDLQINEYKKYQDLSKEYENKINQLSKQIDYLNGFISKIQLECEQYKQKFYDLETQIPLLNSHIQEYENRMIMLANEIQRLNDNICLQGKSTEELKEKNHKLENTISNLRMYEDKCREYEQSLRSMGQMLQEEKNRYINLEKKYEIALQFEIKSKEYENKIILITQEIERLNKVLIQKLQEQENQRQKISQLEYQIIKYQQMEQRVIEYENKLLMHTQEIERLQNINQQKSNELDESRNKCQIYENSCKSFEIQIRALNQRIIELSQQIERLNRQLSEYQEQIDDNKVKRSKMNKDLIDWEARVALLTTEIERLRNVNIIKDQEIDQWKLRYQKLEMQLSEFCLLKEKNKVLNQEIDRLSEEYQTIEIENAQLKQSIVSINDLNVRITDLLVLCVQLFTEVECLRARIKEKQNQVDEMRRSSLASYRN